MQREEIIVTSRKRCRETSQNAAMDKVESRQHTTDFVFDSWKFTYTKHD